MNIFLSTLLLLGAALLQGWFRTPAFMGSIELPLLLSALYCIVLRSTRRSALYAGVLAALLNDSLSPATLGTSIPFYILVAWGVYAVRNEVFGDQLITYFVLGLLGGGLKTIYLLLTCAVTDLQTGGPALIATRLGSNLILGLLTAPLVYLILFRLFRIRFRKKRWA
jgi:rod shape-determining protein MreD